jgi:outer membrane protein OmpA-like peptidoglycan-associated protein/opacity protein-like surface antigen
MAPFLQLRHRLSWGNRSAAGRALALALIGATSSFSPYENRSDLKMAAREGPASNRKGHSMRRKIWTMTALALLAAGQAFAYGEGGGFEIGAYGGYGWPDDYGGLKPKAHFLYGGRVGYFFTHHWDLEASGQRLSTESDFDDPLVPKVDVNLTSWRANLLYNFGAGHVRPFLTGGVGSEKVDVEGDGASSDFGWNAGAGFRWYLSPRWNIRLDGRYVSVKVTDVADETEGNLEGTLGLGLVLGGHKKEEVHVETPNQPPTVTCAAERAEILPGESVNLHATATDPEGGPLSYAWTATAGRVNGTGDAAVLDFTGVTPPSTATVTVRVTDDHNNAASSDCAVRLLEPVKPAEAVSCTSGGFPRNLSRLNNVDKACLDDVAQRLNSDPRARVIVIGHSDSHETKANIAQMRADAVRDYLVAERKIEASRITTRSAGSSKPLATGSDATSMAQNRRVEVWFVPEGAKAPE